ERVPVMEITQDVETDDLVLSASYEIDKVVVTEFDKALSDHLAATKSEGFPSVALSISITDPETGKAWTPVTDQYFRSIPHALRRVAEFALGDRDACPITIYARARELAGRQAFGRADILSSVKAEAIGAAIEFCDMLGEYEFLNISGNFANIVVEPTDRSMEPIIIDLERGTVSIPTRNGGTPFVGALFNPAKQIAAHREAAAYITHLHHAVALAKEKAIWDFRSAAEERIFGFDRALGGQPLSDYRLTAAETLIRRLRAGLGDNLLGLSEQAQITALGWARLIRRARETASIGKNGEERKPVASPVRLISVD
ncbi:MAG: hypothetical protein AAF908_12120, partial [Pseudomonadota bacterium]